MPVIKLYHPLHSTWTVRTLNIFRYVQWPTWLTVINLSNASDILPLCPNIFVYNHSWVFIAYVVFLLEYLENGGKLVFSYYSFHLVFFSVQFHSWSIFKLITLYSIRCFKLYFFISQLISLCLHTSILYVSNYDMDNVIILFWSFSIRHTVSQANIRTYKNVSSNNWKYWALKVFLPKSIQ